jgi:hypothetical protein
MAKAHRNGANEMTKTDHSYSSCSSRWFEVESEPLVFIFVRKVSLLFIKKEVRAGIGMIDDGADDFLVQLRIVLAQRVLEVVGIAE